MKLTIKRLRQMIKKELNESVGALAIAKKLKGKPPNEKQEKMLMVAAAMLVSMIGVTAAVNIYERYTTDYDALADKLSTMSEEQIKVAIDNFRVNKYAIRNYKIPHTSDDPSKRFKRQHLTIDLDKFAKQLSEMPKEELKEILLLPELRDIILEYEAEIQDAPSPDKELALPKDTGDVWKESRRRRMAKHRKK